jgi:sulfite reductase (ferredoxin)
MPFSGEKEDIEITTEAKMQIEKERDAGKEIHESAADKFVDLRGTKCPINFVKTKIALAAMKSGETLELWLDDGEPAENVPRSAKLEGHKVLTQEKVGEYWTIRLLKA